MCNLKLYRKRLIPNECILLKDDILVHRNEDMLITTWKTLNPKTTFSHGCSCYFINEGYKVSKFYRPDNTLLYYYCDIVEFDTDSTDNSLIVTDLLADVIVYPNDTHAILDLDELADAYEQKLISEDQLLRSLRRLNRLLELIQNNRFSTLLTQMNNLGL